MSRPLIGVSTSEMRVAAQTRPLRESEPQRRELALGLSYPRAVVAAGAVAVVLPPTPIDVVDAILDRLDGLVLSGGPDLDPATYAARPHPALGPTEHDLDLFELALCGRARMRGMPVLAICRGLQTLNVARGGTLIQHLPDRGGAVEHRQTEPDDQPTHPVTLVAGSALAQVYGVTTLDVNSFHHQAVDRLGDGLQAVAFAPDGVVEAIEEPGADFVVGVQWHAEGLADRPEHAPLFAAFVAAAERYAAGSAVGSGEQAA